MKYITISAIIILILISTIVFVSKVEAGETHYIIDSSKEGAITFAASESVSVRVERYGKTDFRCRQVDFEEFQAYRDDECWEWVGTAEAEDPDALEKAWEESRSYYMLEYLLRNPPTKAVFYFRLLCTKDSGTTP